MACWRFYSFSSSVSVDSTASRVPYLRHATGPAGTWTPHESRLSRPRRQLKCSAMARQAAPAAATGLWARSSTSSTALRRSPSPSPRAPPGPTRLPHSRSSRSVAPHPSDAARHRPSSTAAGAPSGSGEAGAQLRGMSRPPPPRRRPPRARQKPAVRSRRLGT